MPKQITHKEFENWIREQINHYSPILGIVLIDVGIKFRKETEFLDITCTYPYIDPTIRYSEKAFEAWRDGEIKSDRILHELCHILTDPLYCLINQREFSRDTIINERERLTDMITAVIRKLDKYEK